MGFFEIIIHRKRDATNGFWDLLLVGVATEMGFFEMIMGCKGKGKKDSIGLWVRDW